MAGWLKSSALLGRSIAGKRLVVTSTRSAQCQKREPGSCATARSGWSATSSSKTSFCEAFARSEPVDTFMPGEGLRTHEAASTRSPSISTMQARQLPSGR